MSAEINFSWVSFAGAMASNLLFACRSNFSKALMTRPPTRSGAGLSSSNLYAIVTMVAFVVFAPFIAGKECALWRPTWDRAVRAGHDPRAMARHLFFSGLSHYLNNEVQAIS